MGKTTLLEDYLFFCLLVRGGLFCAPEYYVLFWNGYWHRAGFLSFISWGFVYVACSKEFHALV